MVLGCAECCERVDIEQITSCQVACEKVFKVRSAGFIFVPAYVKPPIYFCGQAPCSSNGANAIAKPMKGAQDELTNRISRCTLRKQNEALVPSTRSSGVGSIISAATRR